MNYINANNVLPEALVDEIKKYAEGVYIYIPKSKSKRSKWGHNTKTRSDMKQRNIRIYDSYLEGHSIEAIAERHYLSTKSIRRILLQIKREMEPLRLMIQKILEAWNIEANVLQIYHSTWSVNDTYVIKEYSDESQLKRNIIMFKTLAKEHIQVPAVIPLPSGEDYYKYDDKFYLLTTHLHGKNTLDLNHQDDVWLYDFGRIIGQLHKAFKVCQKEISYWNNSMLEEMSGWVKNDLDKYGVSSLHLEDAEASIQELSKVYHQLPTQLIHRDIHLGNFLFDKEAFVGYIDFDLSQSNIRIFDICYFLLGILSAGNNHIVDMAIWLNIVKQVVKGYDATNPLKHLEKEAIPCVMMNIELLFAAYFAGIDNESLSEDAVKVFYLIKAHKGEILDVLL